LTLAEGQELLPILNFATKYIEVSSDFLMLSKGTLSLLLPIYFFSAILNILNFATKYIEVSSDFLMLSKGMTF
jgi:hypothetical protein